VPFCSQATSPAAINRLMDKIDSFFNTDMCVLLLVKVKAPGAEQPEQSDNNQINRYDIVQQARHGQNEYAGDKRNQRGDT
jgi:hypothetical protein